MLIYKRFLLVICKPIINKPFTGYSKVLMNFANEQKMVGKRSNQAEEKEDLKCGTCQVEVKSNQNGLYCEWCEKWFHCRCEKVGTEEYKLLNECRLRWFCRRCNGSLPDIRKEQMRLK